MDFKRIEFIFFCAFLSLNIFLGYTYQQSRLDVAAESDVNTVASIESRLGRDKIKFENDFSREIRQGYYLSGQNTDFVEAGMSSVEHQRLSRNFQASPALHISKKEREKSLLDFIQSSAEIYGHGDYTYLNAKGADALRYTFSQEYEHIPFNDETSELAFDLVDASTEELMILGYTQTHLADIEPLREAQDIIAEADAIETLYMSNKIPNEGKIIRTELAYTRLFTVREKNVYIPAWFIWIENSKGNLQVERINGFSNSIISASVPEVKK